MLLDCLESFIDCLRLRGTPILALIIEALDANTCHCFKELKANDVFLLGLGIFLPCCDIHPIYVLDLQVLVVYQATFLAERS